MHVLIAHNEYARPSGEEHALAVISGVLHDHGHRVSDFRRSSAEIGDGVLQGMKAGLAGIRNPFSRAAMSDVLDREQPDAVLVQNVYPLLSHSILRPCSKRGIPIVMRCPNYRLFCPNGLHMTRGRVCEKCLGFGRELWCVFRNCERSLPKSAAYALRNASTRLSGSVRRHVTVYIVLTEFQESRFAAQGIPRERMVVVPNSADPAFASVPETLGQTVSFMGRIAEEKGITDFLTMARNLPHIPFAVAGAVKETARSLIVDAPSNITFHGHLEGDALMSFMRDTRVMVSCSQCFEGFPNSVGQAMVAGRPVVGAALGSLPEIVEDGQTGFLYTPGATDEACRRIDTLHSSEEQCRVMGRAGRERAQRNFSSDAVYERLMHAFETARGIVA